MATSHTYSAALLAAIVVTLVGIAGLFTGSATGAAVFTGGSFSFLSSEGLLSGILIVLGLIFGYSYLRKNIR